MNTPHYPFFFEETASTSSFLSGGFLRIFVPAGAPGKRNECQKPGKRKGKERSRFTPAEYWMHCTSSPETISFVQFFGELHSRKKYSL